MANVESVIRDLLFWTPFLAAGFWWNIVISLVALSVGTGTGYLLALLRLSANVRLVKLSTIVTALTRSVPTFVFQFYLAFMLPDTVSIPVISPGVHFPGWLKASLALAIAVTAFVSDNLLRALHAWREGRRHDARLFVLNWGNYFLIIVMASSTASTIGVPEIVSRCNTVIDSSGQIGMMLWVYTYAMSWFFLFCYSATLLFRYLSDFLDSGHPSRCSNRS